MNPETAAVLYRHQHDPETTERAEGTNVRPFENVDEDVIDRIVDHGYSKDVELLHRVQWYGYAPNGDTWQPSHDLPQSHLR